MPDPIQEITLSRYAAQVLGAHPGLADELVSPQRFARTEMESALAGAQEAPEAELKARLRRLRRRVLLRVMARDLRGLAGLAEVCETMSDLAEVTIAAALAHLGAESLVVVGMGKLGGRELNVSSDIDLVFLHPDAAGEAWNEKAKKLIRLLSEQTEDDDD